MCTMIHLNSFINIRSVMHEASSMVRTNLSEYFIESFFTVLNNYFCQYKRKHEMEFCETGPNGREMLAKD